MSINDTRPIPGTDEYWRQRREAFTLIQTLERAIDIRNRAPMYRAGPGYDPDENYDDVIENIGPWDRVCTLQDQARGNPMVMETLAVQERLDLLTA